MRIRLCLIILLILGVPGLPARGQADDTATSDSLYRAKGWELFTQYLQAPETEEGAAAGWQAFLMWANVGAADDVDEALADVPLDDDVWNWIPRYISAAYAESEARNEGDLIALLQQLRDDVATQSGKSAVLYWLAEAYESAGQSTDALNLYKDIIALNAHPFVVERSIGAVREAELLNPGQEAPSFNAMTIEGETVDLQSLRGQYVLLEFWGTWCTPCLPEIPFLKQLWAEYGTRGLAIIGVALDEDRELLAGFLQQNEMLWPQVAEPQDRTGTISRLYGVNVVPSSYVVGPDGTILARGLRGEELVAAVRRLKGVER